MKFYLFSSAEIKPDWLSRKIMKYLKCDYSHIGVIVEHEGHSAIYHSTGEAVNLKYMDSFMTDHILVHKIDITKHIIDLQFAHGWCEGSIGKDYSESQYLGLIFPWLKNLSGDGRSEMICSEFGARFIDECTTIPSFDRTNCDFIDPKVCIETLQNYLKEYV